MLYTNKHEDQLTPLLNRDYHRLDPLRVINVEQGIFLPLKKISNDGPLMGNGGVLDSDGKYVELSAQIGKGDTRDRFNGSYEFDPADLIHTDEEVIYLGAFPDHWGHFLVDFVGKAWFLLKGSNDLPVVYTSESKEISGVFLDFFKLLGIKTGRLKRVTKPTQYRNIIVPETAYMPCAYYTDEYREIFARVSEQACKIFNPEGKECYEDIYMSRGHFKDAAVKEYGEKSLERNFADNGFKVLYMEELSIAEQAFYIHKAKRVAALSGTLCHNILFGSENTELIILNKTNIINTHQIIINQMMGCKVRTIDVFEEPYEKFPVSYGQGPFLLNSQKIKELFSGSGFLFKGESFTGRCLNFIKYSLACVRVSLYDSYSRLYHKLSSHKHIMAFFRFLKKSVTKGK